LPGARLLPIDRIAPDPDQPRKHFDPAKHEELVQSIRENGLLQPIRVREWKDIDSTTRYIVVIGERRWRAAQEANLTELPCLVVEEDDARERRIQQIVENAHRLDLMPSELLAATQELQAMGMKQQEIARRLNRDQSTVSHYQRVGEHTDLVEQLDTLGIQKAARQAGERNRAAGSTRGRKPASKEESTAGQDETEIKEDHFAAPPSSSRVNRSQTPVERDRHPPPHETPAPAGALTLVVAHRATTAEEWIQSLDGWLTALSNPAGQAWLPALPDTLRDEIAGKLATLLHLVDPVTLSDES